MTPCYRCERWDIWDINYSTENLCLRSIAYRHYAEAAWALEYYKRGGGGSLYEERGGISLERQLGDLNVVGDNPSAGGIVLFTVFKNSYRGHYGIQLG